MTDITSVISINAGVLEDIEQEDEREGWSDGPDAALSPREQAAFEGLVRASYRMPDDEDDACGVCGFWTCSC